MMTHDHKLFPHLQSEQQEQREREDHEMCTNLKAPPLREGPNEPPFIAIVLYFNIK